MTATVKQEPSALNLQWVEGDPITLTFVAKEVDWSGFTFVAKIKASYNADTLLTFTVTPTFNTPDTTIVLSAPDTTALPAGQYVWALKQSAGITLVAGKVLITGSATS